MDSFSAAFFLENMFSYGTRNHIKTTMGNSRIISAQDFHFLAYRVSRSKRTFLLKEEISADKNIWWKSRSRPSVSDQTTCTDRPRPPHTDTQIWTGSAWQEMVIDRMRRGSSNGPPLLVSVFVFLSPSMHANKVSALPPAKRSSIWGRLGYGLLLIYILSWFGQFHPFQFTICSFVGSYSIL
jgi:hypothetical protein